MIPNPPGYIGVTPSPVTEGVGVQVTQQDIADAATDNGLFGAALCVHSSLSSFGHVSGGARAVVDGMLDAGCTVMAPAFCYTLAATPPPGRWLPRNAWDYGDGPPVVSSEVYTPDRNDIDDSMGAISAAVVETLGRSRGNNPLNSFAAVGPMAGKLTAGQAPLDVYAPLRRLARLGGYVVMMGIDLQSMTALHLAEQMAGRVLFRRWANDRGGEVIEAEVGGCSRGFNNIEPPLRPIERRAAVGNSLWRIFPIAALLQRASEAIRNRPEITRCGDTECRRCDDGIAGGPILEGAQSAQA